MLGCLNTKGIPYCNVRKCCCEIRPQSKRTDHFSNIVADHEFSTGCYLFTVSNSGLLFYTKRVDHTQPAMPTCVTNKQQPCGFNNSNDVTHNLVNRCHAVWPTKNTTKAQSRFLQGTAFMLPLLFRSRVFSPTPIPLPQ